MKEHIRSEGNDWVVVWWIKYIEAGILERQDMIKDLPARIDYNRLMSSRMVLDEEAKEHISILHYLSLFDDCVDACYFKFKEEK